MNIFAKTEHNTHEFNIEEVSKGYELTNSDGTLFKGELKPIDDTRYSIIINNESFIVNATAQKDIYTVIIRGKQFEIEIDDEKSRMWKEIIAAKEGEGGSGKIKSQMPGLIVKYLVSEGDEVNEGDGIVILEAMKMENVIKSTVSGTVSKINIQAGNAVEKGVHLMTIE